MILQFIAIDQRNTTHSDAIIKSKITVTKILFSIVGTFRLRVVYHNNILASSVFIIFITALFRR